MKDEKVGKKEINTVSMERNRLRPDEPLRRKRKFGEPSMKLNAMASFHGPMPLEHQCKAMG